MTVRPKKVYTVYTKAELSTAGACSVCALKVFALLQPLLHARVKHRLIRVPVHVFDPRNRTDDQIPTSRQGLQTKNISQKQLRQKKEEEDIISFYCKVSLIL